MDEAIQVPERVKEERNQDLLALVNRIALEGYEALVGQQVEILCEGPSKSNAERLMGRTRTNKIVVIEGDPARLTGEIFPVQVENHHHFTLYGTAAVLGS
jgi:tRNA-2-methylthio-N6-dimethylallyladenosine synthase